MQLIGKSHYIAWFLTASPSSMETAESPDWKSRDRQAETSSTQVNDTRRLWQKKKKWYWSFVKGNSNLFWRKSIVRSCSEKLQWWSSSFYDGLTWLFTHIWSWWGIIFNCLWPQYFLTHANDIHTSDYVMASKNAHLWPLSDTSNTPYYCPYARLAVAVSDMELPYKKFSWQWWRHGTKVFILSGWRRFKWQGNTNAR